MPGCALLLHLAPGDEAAREISSCFIAWVLAREILTQPAQMVVKWPQRSGFGQGGAGQDSHTAICPWVLAKELVRGGKQLPGSALLPPHRSLAGSFRVLRPPFLQAQNSARGEANPPPGGKEGGKGTGHNPQAELAPHQFFLRSSIQQSSKPKQLFLSPL